MPAQAGSNPDDVIRNVLKPTQGRTDRLVINGLPATHFVGARTNAQGQSQTLEATVVSGPNDHTYLLSYAAKDANALARARRQMEEAQGSLRPMTSADRAAAQPWRLKTTPYPRGGFAELARRSPLDQAEPQLRLMNGVYGGGDPQVGQMVKIVQ